MTLTRRPDMEPGWLEVLYSEFNLPYMAELRSFLVQEKSQFTVYPKGSDMFKAFWLTPFTQVKVVILGQDPYHGPGQAHGLSFSVPNEVPLPPSLVNIFNEVEDDLRVSAKTPRKGCLESWAKSGVLLLNSVLSVRANSPGSHRNKGWETFTDAVIRALSDERSDIVFMLWGKYAQAKSSLINPGRHLVLQAAHPSPYSADKGFFGCKHFSKANHYLQKTNQQPIDWGFYTELVK